MLEIVQKVMLVVMLALPDVWVLFVCLLLVVIDGSYELTCLKCDNAATLRDCEGFTECAYDQACYIEKYLNEGTFEVVHRAGCRNIQDCKTVECNKQLFGTTKSLTSIPAALSSSYPPISTIATTKHARFRRDLVVCTECCYSDICNTHGCGSSYYSVNQTSLHCFEKEKVTTNETVQTVKVCQTHEICSGTYKIFSGTYGYTLGCLSKRFCDFFAQKAIEDGRQPDTMCCDKSLCNVNPYSQKTNASTISQLLACPTALVKSTTTSTTPTPTTTSSTTTSPTTTTSTTTIPKTTSSTTTTPTTTTPITTTLTTTTSTTTTPTTTTSTTTTPTTTTPTTTTSTTTTPTTTATTRSTVATTVRTTTSSTTSTASTTSPTMIPLSNKSTLLSTTSHVTRTVAQSTTVFSLGQTVTLRCSVTDKIPEWTYPTGSRINFHGSSIILNSFPYRKRVSVSSAGNLIIQSLQQTDSGQYTCSYPGSGIETVSLAVPGPAIVG